jgi:hypothetical protein
MGPLGGLLRTDGSHHLNWDRHDNCGLQQVRAIRSCKRNSVALVKCHPMSDHEKRS